FSVHSAPPAPIYPLSLHDALPISGQGLVRGPKTFLEVLPGLGLGQVVEVGHLVQARELVLKGISILVRRRPVLLARRGRRDLVGRASCRERGRPAGVQRPWRGQDQTVEV